MKGIGKTALGLNVQFRGHGHGFEYGRQFVVMLSIVRSAISLDSNIVTRIGRIDKYQTTRAYDIYSITSHLPQCHLQLIPRACAFVETKTKDIVNPPSQTPSCLTHTMP